MKKADTTKHTKKRELTGTVIRRSGQRTVAVEVVHALRHPIYKKSMKRTKRYLAHDTSDAAQVGDVVTIQESRPISRHKRWVIISQPKKSK